MGMNWVGTQALFRESLVLSTLLVSVYAATAASQTHACKSRPCPVTIGRQAPALPGTGLFGAGSAYWNGDLFVGGLWPNGTIVIPADSPDLSMKFGWFRANGLRGKLSIQGRRLDATAPPLGADIPEGYGDTGFQASGVIFPTEGCWQVTGKVGDTSLTFVTLVVREKQTR